MNAAALKGTASDNTASEKLKQDSFTAGLSTDRMQALQGLAKSTGVDPERLLKAVDGLAKTMEKAAANPGGAEGQTLASLGQQIEYRDPQTGRMFLRDPSNVFAEQSSKLTGPDLANAHTGVPIGNNGRADMISQLFGGRDALAALPALQQFGMQGSGAYASGHRR